MKTVIEMAREARVYSGCTEWTIEKSATFVTTHESIKRFAELVRADEREACAKVCEMAEPYQAADLIRARSNT
jgi:hypothetical protein